MPWTYSITAPGTTLDPDQGLMALQAEASPIEVVGSSVVVASLTRAKNADNSTSSLQFRSSATGSLLSTVPMPFGGFAGIGTDTVAGRPVAVVYTTISTPAAEQANGGQPVKVVSAYRQDGSLAWTSLGKALATGSATSSGLETTTYGYPVYSAGYTVRNNGSPDSNTAQESYDVLGPDGSVVLHVPRQADAAGDQAHVSLLGGYALVSYDNQDAATDGSAIRVSMSAYDLAHGATQVGSWAEPGSTASGEQGTLLDELGGRLLVAWLGPPQSHSPPTDLAVLNTSTGTAAAVNGVPATAASPSAFGTTDDPATGNVLLYDNGGKNAQSFLIHLASSAVTWTQDASQTCLLPITVHDGTIYGLILGGAGHPMSLATVREADGKVTERGYQIAPIGFTGDAAVFAQSTSPTTLTAIRIGLSPTQ